MQEVVLRKCYQKTALGWGLEVTLRFCRMRRKQEGYETIFHESHVIQWLNSLIVVTRMKTEKMKQRQR